MWITRLALENVGHFHQRVLHFNNEVDATGTRPTAHQEELPQGNGFIVIDGNTGSGKSFILDILWWLMSNKWPRGMERTLTTGYPARPLANRDPGTISCTLKHDDNTLTPESHRYKYIPREQAWKLVGRNNKANAASAFASSGLILYARGDGSFCFYDPIKKRYRLLTESQVLYGRSEIENGRTQSICEGLIRDWDSWNMQKSIPAMMIHELLEILLGDIEFEVGESKRISIDDIQDYVTLRMCGQFVPFPYLSSRIKRVIVFVYMFVWLWTEHQDVASLAGVEQHQHLTLLIDNLDDYCDVESQSEFLYAIKNIYRGRFKSAQIFVAKKTIM